MASPIIGQIPPQIYWMYCGFPASSYPPLCGREVLSSNGFRSSCVPKKDPNGSKWLVFSWPKKGDVTTGEAPVVTVRHRTLRTVCTLASLLPQKSARITMTSPWKGDRLNLVPSHLPPGSGSLCRASSHSLPRLGAGSM